MAMFEKVYRAEYRLDREPKESWKRNVIYQNGEANHAFLVFRSGYMYGKSVALDAMDDEDGK